MEKLLTKEKKPVRLTVEQAKRIKKRLEQLDKVDAITKSGDLDLAARLLSAAYVISGVANGYAEDAVEIVERYGLKVGKIKTKANNLQQSFDTYDKEMWAMIHDHDAGLQLCEDTDVLRTLIDAFVRRDITIKRGPYMAATLFLPNENIKK